MVTLTGSVVADFLERMLSQREIVRAAGATAIALEVMKQKFDAGLQPRDDDFFRIRTGHRPKSEELYEAMMIKSKNQYEEHKVIFMRIYLPMLALMRGYPLTWYLGLCLSWTN